MLFDYKGDKSDKFCGIFMLYENYEIIYEIEKFREGILFKKFCVVLCVEKLLVFVFLVYIWMFFLFDYLDGIFEKSWFGVEMVEELWLLFFFFLDSLFIS